MLCLSRAVCIDKLMYTAVCVFRVRMLFMATRSHLRLHCDESKTSDDDKQQHLSNEFMTVAVRRGIRAIERVTRVKGASYNRHYRTDCLCLVWSVVTADV